MATTKELEKAIFKLNNNSYPKYGAKGSYYFLPSKEKYIVLYFVEDGVSVDFYCRYKDHNMKGELIAYINGYLKGKEYANKSNQN